MKRMVKKLLLILTTSTVFAVGAVLLCITAYGKEEITSISVKITDNILTDENLETRLLWDETTEAYTEQSYYDIYDFDNITLTVNYGNNAKSYTGTEITTLCGMLDTPLLITDNQDKKQWQTGNTYTVTYSLGDFSATADYSVEETMLYSVTVIPRYDIKPIFELDGAFDTATDINGIIYQRFKYDLQKYDYDIQLRYKNGRVTYCSNHNLKALTGLDISFVQADGQLAVGKQTAVAVIGSKTSAFSYEITENPVQSVELFMTDGADKLDINDGYYDTDDNGIKYFRYVIDRTKINANVTYKNGTKSVYTLSELVTALGGNLELFDNQSTEIWKSGKVTVKGKIRGIETALTVNIAGGSITGLNAMSDGFNVAKLTWDRVSCHGYEIRQLIGNKWEKLADVPHNKNSFVVSGLTAGSHSFSISSYTEENGTRHYTGTVKADTNVPLSKVKSFIATNRSESTVDIAWDKCKDADGYYIFRYINGRWVIIATLGKNYDSAVISKLEAGETYKFGIKPFVLIDGVKYAGEFTGLYNQKTLSAKPQNVTVTNADNTTVTLKWNKSAGADGYYIYKNVNNVPKQIAVVAGNVTEVTVISLQPSAVYSFEIKAFNKIGNVIYRSEASKIENVRTAPAKVADFIATDIRQTETDVSWSKVNGADGYFLYQFIGDKWVHIATLGSSYDSVTIMKLIGGTEYKFGIKAFNKQNGKIYTGEFKGLYGIKTPS